MASLYKRNGSGIWWVRVQLNGTRIQRSSQDLQIENAPHKSAAASLVTIADKISNLRDLAANQPSGWGVERRRNYFDWAKAVVDGLPIREPRLGELFNEIYAQRP
jgi:GTP diphosphokinase / guanosine-3',5'-bis(diphosphate) 3'-diphosphatase